MVLQKYVVFSWKSMGGGYKIKGFLAATLLCQKSSEIVLVKQLCFAYKNEGVFDGTFVNEHRLEKLKKDGKKIKFPICFFRNNLSVDDLVEMAKDFTDYANDDTKDTNYQISLINGFELDVSNGCVEGCEIY